MRLPLAPVILRTRAVYQTALETGRSAEEAHDPTAAKEMAGLWAYLAPLILADRDEAPING